MLLRGGIHGQKLDGLKGDFTVGHAEIDNKHDWANDGFIDIAMTTLIEFRTIPHVAVFSVQPAKGILTCAALRLRSLSFSEGWCCKQLPCCGMWADHSSY